jgi:single-strand DNA-binding protein
MVRGLNKIQVIGNLGRDPEMRFTPGGSPVTQFSVAVNRRRRGTDGQMAEETEWFRVVCWERLAEIADQYLKKGMPVYVEGRLQTRRFTGNDGQERTSVEIVANDLVMLSGREDGSAPPPDSAPTRSTESEEEDFDELPF